MKNEKSTLDNGYTTLFTYDNGVQYIIQGSASHIVAEDGIGLTLKNKHFPQIEEVKEVEPVEIVEKRRDMLKKANAMRRRAGSNKAYNPKHSTRIKAMMIGRADALESKAYSL